MARERKLMKYIGERDGQLRRKTLTVAGQIGGLTDRWLDIQVDGQMSVSVSVSMYGQRV